MAKNGMQQLLLANVRQDTNGMDNSVKELMNVLPTESGILPINNVFAHKIITGAAMLAYQSLSAKEINTGIKTSKNVLAFWGTNSTEFLVFIVPTGKFGIRQV